jgi:hypothetical protein
MSLCSDVPIIFLIDQSNTFYCEHVILSQPLTQATLNLQISAWVLVIVQSRDSTPVSIMCCQSYASSISLLTATSHRSTIADKLFNLAAGRSSLSQRNPGNIWYACWQPNPDTPPAYHRHFRFSLQVIDCSWYIEARKHCQMIHEATYSVAQPHDLNMRGWWYFSLSAKRFEL